MAADQGLSGDHQAHQRRQRGLSRAEAVALAWLEPQQNPRISVITSLEAFPRLPLDDAILLSTAR